MLLLELMNEKHMTRAELSRRSGVPESTLRDILNGKAQIDHCEAGTLLTIADVLETTVDEIVVTYWEEALLHHDREVPLEELHDDSSMLTFYMIVDATKLALTAYSDLEFVCEICEEHWIERFHAEGAYRIAFFLLGFIDWVHRKHHLILDPHLHPTAVRHWIIQSTPSLRWSMMTPMTSAARRSLRRKMPFRSLPASISL